ncbi:MAG: family efflux transporter subunit [Proteobacteria bacterium]|nr:family efflux transporter subunit [Pseudomonadota bacterium]
MTRLRPGMLAPVLLGSLLVACEPGGEATTPLYESVPVERRNIVVAVEAAGTIEPISTVELKSKASGEVLDISAETGDEVGQGALLVRIDPRTARNRLDQSQADLTAARARLSIARAQQERAETLLNQGLLSKPDYEKAALELATSQAQVVAGQVSVENARIALNDTEIRAPIAGTIIEKKVETGQVISSPTQDVGGGTLLLKMADLSQVQVRVLVDETDIGKIAAGLPATVSVSAYPNQPFSGTVLKVEPQAVVEQNVTMFGVLVSIDNRDRLLKPGMNSEVTITVARKDDVLALPVPALRTSRDLATTAQILGLTEDDLSAQLQASRGDEGGGDAAASSAPRTLTVGDRTVELPEGVTAEQVRAAMDKRRSGAELTPGESAMMRRVFQGNGAGGGRPAGSYQFGSDFWVVAERDGRPVPVAVRTGITDLDRAEIVAGLAEGEKVLLLPSSHLMETQQQLQSFINRRMGGVPGISQRQ